MSTDAPNPQPAAGSPPPTLRMSRIRRRFGATTALDGVDLEVGAGEIRALVGENGAGKSTLMRILAGDLPPDDGAMAIDGAAYAPRSPREAEARGVAMIHQEPAIAPHLSVAENLVLGTESRRGPLVDGRRNRERARALLARVGLASLDPRRAAAALAPGERQLVAIARALDRGGRVLVLDEPTSSLTRVETERLFALLRRLRGEGLAIVFISHALEEVREIADTWTVLRDGRTVGDGAVDAFEIDAIVALMLGRAAEIAAQRTPRTPGDVVLELENVAGARGGDATLRLHRGEVVGIYGLVGAGRTELLRAVFGLDAVVHGRLRVHGRPGAASPRRRWRQGAGLVSEDRIGEGLAPVRSVAENLCLARLDRVGRGGVVTDRALRAAGEPWIDRLRVRCASPGQPVRALSGGNQQKVAIARLLHAQCDVLLLDEPTRGIDVGARAIVYETIEALARGDAALARRPCGVLLASSSLPELLATCDRIAVMRRGVLGAPHPVHETSEHELLREATFGAEAAA